MGVAETRGSLSGARRQPTMLPPLTRSMPLPKLKDIKWVTTDCYGTLIDWEKGILDAFNAEADRDGFSFDEDAVHQALLRGPGGDHGRLVRALRRGPAPRRRSRPPARSAGSSSPRGPSSCPTASPAGSRSARRTPRWTGSRSATTSGSSPTSTTSCSASRAATCEPSSTWSSPRSRSAATSPTPPTSRSARGGSAARRAGSTSASGYETDVAPLLKMNVPVIWVNRNGEKLEGRKTPDRDGQEPSRRGGAPRREVARWRRARQRSIAIPPTRPWWRARTSASRPSAAAARSRRDEPRRAPEPDHRSAG